MHPVLCHAVQNFNLDRLMALDSYPRLLSVLQAGKQRQVALTLVQNLVASSNPVADPAQVRLLLTFMQPLVDAGTRGFDVVRFAPLPRHTPDHSAACAASATARHTAYRSSPTCWMSSGHCTACRCTLAAQAAGSDRAVSARTAVTLLCSHVVSQAAAA